MSDHTAIEWCDSTFNPWTGCTKISPACDHCYAESLSKRAPKTIAQWGAGQPRRRTSAANWNKPIRWNRWPFYGCTACGYRGESIVVTARGHQCPECEHASGSDMHARRRVFCASLADVFDNEVDPQWRRDLLRLIASTQQLDWLLLTKRIGNALPMLEEAAGSFGMTWGAHWRNVWLGATICNQAEADRDIPKLLATPARVRFLSIEPMLGRVDLCEALGMWWNQTMGCFESLSDRFNPRGLDWVIAGGESGAHARPSHPDWFRALRDQCAAAGVPFLFKQWGEWWEADSDARDPDTGGHVAVDPDGLDGEELWDPRTGSLVTMGGRRFTPETLPADTPARLMVRIGKKAAGRMLDGREHSEFPSNG